MKNLKELNEMKNEKNDIFGTHFNFIIQNAVNNLVSKSNGVNRFINELSDWTLEAKEEIIKNIENVFERWLFIYWFKKTNSNFKRIIKIDIK